MKITLRFFRLVLTTFPLLTLAYAQGHPGSDSGNTGVGGSDFNSAGADAWEGRPASKIGLRGNSPDRHVIPTGSTRARMADNLSPSPEDFLSAGQSSAQLTAGLIDAGPAIDAARAVNGSVVLPCGTYSIQHPLAPMLTNGATIVAVSKMCVTLRRDMTTGDMITIGVVGGSGHGPFHTRVAGINITSPYAGASGSAIVVGTHYDTEISNFSVDGNWPGDEIVVHGGGASAITRVHDFVLGTISGVVTGSCIHLLHYAVDTYIDRGNSNKCGAGSGILIENASGIQLSHMDIFGGTGGGVVVSPSSSSGENVNALYADNVWVDTSSATAWSFQGTGPITDIHLSNIWGSGSGTTDFGTTITRASSGFSITNSNLDGMSLSGGHFSHNGANGIDIKAGTNIAVGGGTQIWNNDALAENGASCVRPAYDGVLFSTTGRVRLTDSSSGAGGYMSKIGGLPNCQRFGFKDGGSGIYTIANNDFGGNVTAGVVSAGISLLAMSNNVGFTTRNSGQSTVPGGSQCVTIPLGLASGIPDAAIHFSFGLLGTSTINPYAVGASSFWQTAVSAGSVQVCASAALTASVALSWHAGAYAE